MSQFVSMAAALDWRERLADDRIMNYMHELAMSGAKILADAWGTEQLGDDGLTAAMCNVRLPSSDPDRIKLLTPGLLEKYGTYVPVWSLPFSSENAFYVRVSAQIYNDKSDFENLAKWVLELLHNGLNPERAAPE